MSGQFLFVFYNEEQKELQVAIATTEEEARRVLAATSETDESEIVYLANQSKKYLKLIASQTAEKTGAILSVVVDMSEGFSIHTEQ